jgi:hypothetical protein
MIVRSESDNFIANTALVATEIFKFPTQDTEINFEPLKIPKITGPLQMESHQINKMQQQQEPRKSVPRSPIVLKPAFKLIFLTVVGITLLAGVAEIVMAGFWTTPTPNQQSAFEAIGFAWKAGIGAIFGLLGGKVA